MAGPDDRILPLAIGLFLAITAAGSSRNYGLRYLLPLAPLAIVWVSRLAERPETRGRLAGPGSSGVGLTGQAIAVAAIHPHELTLFQRGLAGARWAAGTSWPTPISTGARGSGAWPGSSTTSRNSAT